MAVAMKDIRKGTRVMLSNGWEAEVLDNLTNRSTRMCKVYGTYTEVGSCYSTDIQSAFVDGVWHFVRHSDKQLAAKANRASWGF